MAAKIHKYGTKSYESHVEGATERGEPHVYAVSASKQCVSGVPRRTRGGGTMSRTSWAKHFSRMVVTGVTSREAAVTAVRKALRPSARGAGGGCKILVDVWRLKA